MTLDPHPELRCRCLSRIDTGDPESAPNPYVDRCRNRATAEDGWCDHCRTPHEACFYGCCHGDGLKRSWVTDPREECLTFDKEG